MRRTHKTTKTVVSVDGKKIRTIRILAITNIRYHKWPPFFVDRILLVSDLTSPRGRLATAVLRPAAAHLPGYLSLWRILFVLLELTRNEGLRVRLPPGREQIRNLSNRRLVTDDTDRLKESSRVVGKVKRTNPS